MVMGADNCIVMLLVMPLLQLPEAEAIVAAEGPVMTKSVPSGAIELQLTGSAKVMVRDDGEQEGCVMVPMGSGCCAASEKDVLLPAFTCAPHCPIKVLPSLPATTCTW